MRQYTANINFSAIEMDRGNQSIFITTDIKHSQIIHNILPPILNTVKSSTISALGNTARNSVKLRNEFLVMSVNQRLSGVWLSEYFSQNSRSAFLLITCILFQKITPPRIPRPPEKTVVCRGHPFCLGVCSAVDVRLHPLKSALVRGQSGLHLGQRCRVRGQ